MTISRQEALARGLQEYYTGKPCKHGHIDWRHISGACKECLRVNAREYYHTVKKKEHPNPVGRPKKPLPKGNKLKQLVSKTLRNLSWRQS